MAISTDFELTDATTGEYWCRWDERWVDPNVEPDHFCLGEHDD